MSTTGATRSAGKWTVFGLVAVAVFMSTLDGSIVNIALPVIMEDYGVSLAAVKWVMMVYLLTVSSLLLSFGRLSDIRGRRWVYAGGFLLFALGSFGCGLSPGVDWLIAARVLQGAGAAMLMACSPALVVDIFPENERGRALGAVGTVVAAGLTTGPALGGLILHVFGWPMIFWINIPIGLVSAVFALRVLKGGPGDRRRSESFDLAGGLALATGMSCLIVTFSEGPVWGLVDPRTVAFACVSAGCGVLLAVRSRRLANPVFEPALVRIRLFALPVLSTVLLFVCLFSMLFLMPFYLMHPAGYPVGRAGTIMTIPFIALFFVAPAAGWLFDRIGASRGICTIGMLLLAAALLLISQLDTQASFWSIAWRMVMTGVGIALFTPPNNSVTMSAIQPRYRGIAAATIATARNIGMVCGVALSGIVFNQVYAQWSGGAPFTVYDSEEAGAFMAAFRYAIRTGAAAAFLGAVLAFLRGPEPGRSVAGSNRF